MKRLISFFSEHTLWTNSIIVIVVFLGLFGFSQLKRSFFPEKPASDIDIKVSYPLASAEEVELEVTTRIEQRLRSIPEIDHTYSRSKEGGCKVVVVVKDQQKIGETYEAVKNELRKINSFPKEMLAPVVEIDKRADRGLRFVLYGKSGTSQLTNLATQIEHDIYESGLISKLSVFGKPINEISIELDRDVLFQYNLTMAEIAHAIRRQNRNQSLGEFQTVQNKFKLSNSDKTNNQEELKKLKIKTFADGSILHLEDFAEIKKSIASNSTESFFNHERCITFIVKKTANEDIVDISNWTQKYIDQFNQNHSSFKLALVNDSADAVNEGISLISSSGLIGLILVLLILGIFLNMKLSFWVAFGIPFSFLGMIICASMMGYTINRLSLFGMILVVGILVDDGIVIGENIYAHFERGKSAMQAAIEGALEVLPAVFSSILTTVIVFIGLFFIEGKLGQVISELAGVVILSLTFSLIEATVILPGHLSTLKRKEHKNSYLTKILTRCKDDWYPNIIRFLLRWRYASLVTTISLFLITILLLQKTNVLQFSFFPNLEASSLKVSLVLKRGTPADETKETLFRIREKIDQVSADLKQSNKGHKIIRATNTIIGFSEKENGDHTGMITIELTKGTISNSELAETLRNKIGTLGQAEYFSIGTSHVFGAPVSMHLVGNKSQELSACKTSFIGMLTEVSGVKEVNSDDIGTANLFDIKLNERAFILGLNKTDVLNQVRAYMNGIEVQRFPNGTRDQKLWLRTRKQYRNEFADLSDLPIKSKRGDILLLDEITEITPRFSSTMIKHYNGKRQIHIEADQINRNEAVEPIIKQIQEDIIPQLSQKYPGVQFLLGGQQKENESFSRSVFRVLLILVPAIFIIIMLTLKSITQPILITVTFVVAAIGALIGHAIHGSAVVIMSNLGLIGLIGIMVNDAIVFADRFNDLIRGGVQIEEAIIEAGKSRLRAIVLTSITTMAGLYPLILSSGEEALFLSPMAIAIVYGVLFGTLFILLFFPVLLLIASDIRLRFALLNGVVDQYWQQIWEGTRSDLKSIPTREELEPGKRRK